MQFQQQEPDIKASSSFTFQDVVNSMNIVKAFPICFVQEQTLLNEEDRQEKYLALKDLDDFFKNSLKPQAAELLHNRSILGEISRIIENDQQPLEYSSDDDFMYDRGDSEYKNDLDMFEQRIDENALILKPLDSLDRPMSDEDQVMIQVKQVRDLLEKEKGKTSAKKLNLGEIISTKIETSVIIQQHFLTEKDLAIVNRSKTLIYGNVKAMVPLMRERLTLDFDDQSKPRYKRGAKVPLREERIFGILTRFQVGHIPSLDICFTEDEENFIRDSYIFKSVKSNNLQINHESINTFNNNESLKFSVNQEMKKLLEINDYSKEAIINDMCDQFVQVGTLNQIETFHKFLMNDLYREEKCIDFTKAFVKGREIDKKYYIVPLKIADAESMEDEVEYKIDRELLEKVEKISILGYKGVQPHITQEMEENKIYGEERFKHMNNSILVKEDKRHRCYHYFQMFENLQEMRAEDFATAIKGKPENLNCTTAYDLLFNVATRFQSINSFRDCLFHVEQDNQQIKKLPIMLLDPAKIISHRKFKYALDQCPKRPNKKQEYKKQYKEKNNLTTSQGKPIFSSYNIYRHYLNLEQWERASQLPLVLLFFERSLYTHQLTQELGTEIHPEFVLWATSAAGIQSSKKCYETLETYGDTILKLAATILSYFYQQNDSEADEYKIDQLKIAFITNLYLFRVGKRLKFNRYIRTADPDVKSWNPPFSEQVSANECLNCNGKHIADTVESVLGAHFMTNNLRKTLQLISDIKLVPLKQAHLLDLFPDKDLTFILGGDIDAYQFDISDTVEDIFTKYFNVQQVDQPSQQRLFKLIDKNEKSPKFGEAFIDLLENGEQLRDLGTRELEKILIEYLLPVEEILGYSFQNKFTLLEAFTHKSFKEYHGLTLTYEKLEVLGDAILDYIANSNLIKYTILEKYNLQERLSQEYITQEDFQPFDAHQAKSLLTKNDFLAKLVCLFGLHKYILYHKPKQLSIKELKEQILKESGGALEQWKLQKKLKEQMNEKDADKYIFHSFRRNFLINGRQAEIFEAPKILGDVFESIMGGIFIDGGIEKVIEVYQHLLSPFILFTAKYSKKLYKEPKEDFFLLANQLKIKPTTKQTEIEVANIEEFIQNLNQPELLKSVYATIDKKKTSEEQFEELLKYKMLKCEIIFNGNEVMTTGYGNTKKQAERNASIEGYNWLIANKVNKSNNNNDNNMMEIC